MRYRGVDSDGFEMGNEIVEVSGSLVGVNETLGGVTVELIVKAGAMISGKTVGSTGADF